MRLALVTQHNLQTWEVDDRPLHAALAARGVEVLHVPWDQAGFDWSSVDGALLRTTWDYQTDLPRFLAWTRAAAAQTQLFNPPEVVAWNSRKTYLRALGERGVPIAPSRWWSPGDSADLGPALRAAGWSRAFLKPVVGASASDTLRFVVDDAGVAAAAAHLTAVNAPMIVQPYLSTVETDGEVSVIVVDGVPSHGVRKIPVPGDYRVQDDYGAIDVAIDVSDELMALAEAALAGARDILGLTEPLLYARADALLHDGRLVLNELEIIEPSLFFRHAPRAADVLADALIARVRHGAAKGWSRGGTVPAVGG